MNYFSSPFSFSLKLIKWPQKKNRHTFFFGRFYEKFSLRVLLSFCFFIFTKFSLVLLMKVWLIQKTCYNVVFLLFIIFNTKCLAIDSKSKNTKKATYFISIATATFFLTVFLKNGNIYSSWICKANEEIRENLVFQFTTMIIFVKSSTKVLKTRWTFFVRVVFYINSSVSAIYFAQEWSWW